MDENLPIFKKNTQFLAKLSMAKDLIIDIENNKKRIRQLKRKIEDRSDSQAR